jgi:hypothetical protein
VEGSAIVGTQDTPGNGGILLTDAPYGDFELILEVNNDFGTDSGIFLRSTEDGRAYQGLVDYKAGGNVMGVFGEGLSGGIFVRNYIFGNTPDVIQPVDGGFPLPITPAQWPNLWNVGGWNEVRIRVTGNPPTITTWINGELRHPGQGSIGLQVHAGNEYFGKFVRYRNVRVKPLEA